MVLPMLGTAHVQALRDHGRPLTAPNDLSPHSSRLVRKLKERGAVPADADDEAGNSYGFQDAPTWSAIPALPGRRVPDADVRAGKRAARAIVRAGRPRKQRETYTQGKLL
jgi:hypothetical protein